MISITCPSEAEAYLDGRGRVADELVDKEQVDIASCLYINVLFFILQLACREPSVAMIPPQARSCKTVEDVIQGLFFHCLLSTLYVLM